MQGKIIKGIAGFYYVHAEDGNVYECKAKGVFRNKKIKPLVGDNVEMDVINATELTGNVADILPRKNELIRPAVANIDQTLVVFASLSPEPNFNLLDRFLIMMEQKDLPCIICFNKQDLFSEEEKQELFKAYSINDKKMEEELIEKYALDDLFKKKEIVEKTEESQESIALEKYKEENFIKKLLNRIMRVFIKR